jgi:hypothetical protein
VQETVKLETTQTGDAWFCAAVQYVYGEEVLVRIDNKLNEWNRDQPTFTMEVPDAKEIGVMQTDFQKGDLAISDLKSYVRTYTFLLRRLREMRKAGQMTWVA